MFVRMCVSTMYSVQKHGTYELNMDTAHAQNHCQSSEASARPMEWAAWRDSVAARFPLRKATTTSGANVHSNLLRLIRDGGKGGGGNGYICPTTYS